MATSALQFLHTYWEIVLVVAVPTAAAVGFLVHALTARKAALEIRKLRLEIQKLKKQQSEEDAIITIATFEQVREYGVKPRHRVSASRGCFIATAVYGSYESQEVKVLRLLRDEYILNMPLGTSFVKLYYVVSPPISQWLMAKPLILNVVRQILNFVVRWYERKRLTRHE